MYKLFLEMIQDAHERCNMLRSMNEFVDEMIEDGYYVEF